MKNFSRAVIVVAYLNRKAKSEMCVDKLEYVNISILSIVIKSFPWLSSSVPLKYLFHDTWNASFSPWTLQKN
jgi:hypothetical protein